MTEKTNDNFMDIFKKKLISILMKVKEYEPEKLKEQFYNIDEEGNTFFSTLSTSHIINIEVIDFLINEGFDFTKDFFPKNYKIVSNKTYNNKWATYEERRNNKDLEKNDIYYDEYLNSFINLNDDTLLHLTKKIHEKDKNYFKKLSSKNYFLLHEILQSEKIKTFSFLVSIGLDMEEVNRRDLTLIKIAEQITTLYNIYLENYNKIYGEKIEDTFEDTLEFIKNKSKSVYKNSEHKLNGVLSFYEKNLSKFSKEQQEKLIAATLLSENPNLLKKVLKIYGTTIKNYKPEFYPLWLNLGEAKHQNYYYFLIEDMGVSIKDKIKNKDGTDQKEDYFIYHLSLFLKNMSVKEYHENGDSSLIGRNSNKDARDRKIQNTLLSFITPEFLTETLIFKNETINWFNFIFDDYDMTKQLLNYINNINFKEDFNQNKIQEFLEETWFSKIKNKDGADQKEDYFICHYITNKLNYSGNIPKILSEDYLQKDIEKCIYTTEQKVELLKSYLNLFYSEIKNSEKSNYSYISKRKINHFNSLFNNLKHDETVEWKKINIDENIMTTLKKEFPDFVTEIKSLLLHEHMIYELAHKNKKNNLRKL